MKINGVHALINLLSQQVARQPPVAALKADRIRALSDLLQKTDSPDERIDILRNILAEGNVRRTGIKAVDALLETEPRHAAEGWRVSMGAADKINQLQKTVSGRQWEAESGSDAVQASAYNVVEDRMIFSDSLAEDKGVDRFVPSKEDLEKAIVLVQRRLTEAEDPDFRFGRFDADAEVADLKGRIILISCGIAILLGILATLV